MYNYSDLLIIPKENESIFENNRKKTLSTLEKFGLENVLYTFIEDYEYQSNGESYTEIKPYTRYNENSIDILDGVHDIYIFDHYAIGSLWVTENGIVIMELADLDTIGEEDEDPFEKVENYDIWCDCECRLARLN
jgi:hypothetical protein